ncbi:MAG: ATP-binding cassette, subfamily bacterial [Actinomycetota bacterium]|nr:ATP-binding cassette, subfamily bacterial [Actinomycetota bacterium]
MGAFGVGSPFAGGVAAGNTGLPFAGVPPELAAKAQKILDTEPEHAPPVISFTQQHRERKRLTLSRFLAPHRGGLSIAVGLVAVETAMVTSGPFLTGLAIDHGIKAKDQGALFAIAGVFIATVFFGTVFGAARVAYAGRIGERLMYELRVRVFSHFQRLSLDFFTDEKAGVLMSRMTSDIESLTQLFQEGLVNMFVQILTLAIIAVILFVTNVMLALLTVGIVVPIMLVLTLWFRRASDRGFALARDRIALVLADLSENLSGIRVITGHNRRRHNLVHHRNVVGEYRDANNYTARVGALYGPGAEAVSVAGQAILLAAGSAMVLDGRLQIGQLIAFFLYLTMFFAPIQQLVQLYNTYQQGRAALRKLGDVLLTQPDVLESPDAHDLPTIAGEITLEHVTFGYDPRQPVLRDVSLVIAPGETLAVVGETGAGKSTIAKLVTRFYDATEGRVLIDGHDLKDVTFESLRRQIGVVPQEAFLFGGTIRDNITFARPDASDADIAEACTLIGLDDLLERQAGGLDSPVHERGVSLSSGERQLLALARAFLARPRVLVLDEATSNLDLKSETRIERALDVLLEGRTAIIIAHRLATAMRADRIAVVHDGRIVEIGSHDELVAMGGRYAELYATWMSHTDTSAAQGA